MTRIAVVGAGGLLGTDLMDVLRLFSPAGFSRARLDITDRKAVNEALVGFDVVINAAAYTRVDDAETRRDLAFAVNALGPKNIAETCALHGQSLIHLSTDYVFDGKATNPYKTRHQMNPQSVYGESKAEGEKHVQETLPDSSVIVRTAWLYGHNGPNFVTNILNLSQTRDSLQVVDDQVGQPTWSKDLANMVKNLVTLRIRSGIFHGTNGGQASWWDFAWRIFETAGLNPERIDRTTSADFVRPAPRPAWSVLDHTDWGQHGMIAPRSWEAAFAEAWNTEFANQYTGLQRSSGP